MNTRRWFRKRKFTFASRKPANFYHRLTKRGRNTQQRDVSPLQLFLRFAYIRNQPQHHQQLTFQDVYRQLLRNYHVAFDERYMWD